MRNWVVLYVSALWEPPSRCPISKLSTYSEPSWPCGSFKTIWVKIGAHQKTGLPVCLTAAKGGG